MSKKDFNNFFASLWNTFPHPCFVVDKKLEIIDINVSSEIICMTSKHRMIGKTINDFVEKGSLLLKVIDQTNVKQSPIVIYDIDIFGERKKLENLTLFFTNRGLLDYILLVMNPNPKKKGLIKNCFIKMLQDQFQVYLQCWLMKLEILLLVFLEQRNF